MLGRQEACGIKGVGAKCGESQCQPGRIVTGLWNKNIVGKITELSENTGNGLAGVSAVQDKGKAGMENCGQGLELLGSGISKPLPRAIPYRPLLPPP